MKLEHVDTIKVINDRADELRRRQTKHLSSKEHRENVGRIRELVFLSHKLMTMEQGAGRPDHYAGPSEDPDVMSVNHPNPDYLETSEDLARDIS